MSADGPVSSSVSASLEISVPPYVGPGTSAGFSTVNTESSVFNTGFEAKGVKILPGALQEIMRGNSLSFLNKKSSLHFNFEFLSEDALNIIRRIFNTNPEAKEFKGEGVGLQNIEGVDLAAYDISMLTAEEQQFIQQLLIGDEAEEDEEEEKDNESSWFIEDAVMQEKVNVKDTSGITQIELDSREETVSLLISDFDCLKV